MSEEELKLAAENRRIEEYMEKHRFIMRVRNIIGNLEVATISAVVPMVCGAVGAVVMYLLVRGGAL